MSRGKKLGDFAMYDNNPYSIDWLFTKRDIERGETLGFYDDDDGCQIEVKKVDVLKYTTEDRKPFVKVYSYGFDMAKELCTPALKVWCYIGDNLKKNTNIISLNVNDIMSYTGYNSSANIYWGICELLEKKIIARKVGKDEYYINPNIFFRGNRMSLENKTIK